MAKVTDPQVGAAFLGAAYLNSKSNEIFAGRATDEGPFIKVRGKKMQAGIVTDVSTIEATAVLEQLLGLAEQEYKLEACVTVEPAPELLLRVDKDTMGYGQEKVQQLEESLIVDEAFTATYFDLWLNEVHVVLEDKAARQAAHNLMNFKVAKAAKRLARMRNSQIATELMTATEIVGNEWDDMATPPNSDHNPLDDLHTAISTIECLGFTVKYVALNPDDWAHFLQNTYVAPMVQAGLLTVGAKPTLTLPGWPSIAVITDCHITAGKAIVGSPEAVILADGGDETVKYRHELKRYTGYVTRQYMQPEIVEGDAIRELTGLQ